MSKSDIATVGPGKAAILLGRNPRTIARWSDDPSHPLKPDHITAGGQRRFALDLVMRLAAEMRSEVAA